MAMCRLACAAVILLLALSSARASGPSAIDWLTKAEVYNGWYKAWDDVAIAKMRGTPFVIGCPPERKVVDKAHAMGVRALTYVTFYQMPGKGVYQHADLSKHPDWNIITPEGKDGISVFVESEGAVGWVTVCQNSPGYRKAMLDYVKFVMDQGVDGLFIDNGCPEVVCEGPKYGRHKHIYPGKDNMYAYRELLKDVRAEVRKHGADKVTIVNPGEPREEWICACDGQMLESYICTWASDRRWHSEAQLLDFQKRWASFPDRGEVVVALSYLGHTKNPRREDAFYCYAWARISGFVWADWYTGGNDVTAIYKLRLGQPTGKMETGDGYYLRRFERGIVVASSEKRGAALDLGCNGVKGVLDVFEGKHLKPGVSGEYRVAIEPGQGRVYLLDRP